MEWVETTGRTLEDAKESALDQLGVDEVDAEFEVLEEPRAGLFGRIRGEARVRARVRPTVPRPKEDRRDRRRRGRAGTDSTDSTGGDAGGGVALAENHDQGAGESGQTDVRENAGRSTSNGNAKRGGTSAGAAAAGGASTESPGGAPDDSSGGSAGGSNRRRRRSRSRSSAAKRAAGAQSTAAGQPGSGSAQSESRVGGAGRTSPAPTGSGGSAGEAVRIAAAARSLQTGESVNQGHSTNGGGDMSAEVSLEEQGRIAEEFVKGLVSEFGLEAAVKVTTSGDEEVKLDLSGSELGLLIGPKGSTLLALQDLTRTAVHHQTGATNGRIFVDVGAYRQKRSEALARFAQEVAAKVKETGSPSALEPMAAPDRKVVHDALTDVEGVATFSEGEDPRRRVVIAPASSSSS